MYKQRAVLCVIGDVQGVGFRYAAREKAREFGIELQEAANMPDGSLRIVVSGEGIALQKFIDWANVGPQFANVKRVEV